MELHILVWGMAVASEGISKRTIWAGMAAAVLFAGAAIGGTEVLAPSANAEEDLEALARQMDLGRPYIGGPLPGAEDLVGPPPVAGSAAHDRDVAANGRALAAAGTERFKLATRDANLTTGWFGDAFSCAAGREISEEATPALANLIRRSATDFGMSTSAVKELHQRPRPFISNGAATCTPEHEALLRGNGSYPSGHSAIGYGIGLVLASVLPDRAALVLQRGRAFAQSRAVCNVHWLSDVEAGEQTAAAVFARLNSKEDYAADLAAARKEVAELAAKPAPAEVCQAEKSALEE